MHSSPGRPAGPSKSSGQHFGSRLAWMADGTLWMSIGDGGNPPSAWATCWRASRPKTWAATKVVRQEKLDIGKRVRDVRQRPDGHLYVLTDEDHAQILRIVPDKS